MRKELKDYRNRILRYSAAAMLVLGFLSWLAVGIDGIFFLGIAVGTVGSMLNFVILEISLERAVQYGERRARQLAFKNYIYRSMLLCTIFLICYLQISMHCALGCALGFFSSKVAIYADGWIHRKDT